MGEPGRRGLGYRHCLPYFRRAEAWKFGADDYRGDDGPLAVNAGNEMQNPLYRAFIAAGVEAGYPATEDYNGYRQEGFGPMHMTVKDGVRWSTANAYLKPARGRANLTVVTGALARRVIIEARRAVGVDYIKGRVVDWRARGGVARDVVLASGETLAADSFVLAAGAWSAEIGAMIGLTLPVEPMCRESHYFVTSNEIEPLPFIKTETHLAFGP